MDWMEISYISESWQTIIICIINHYEVMSLLGGFTLRITFPLNCIAHDIYDKKTAVTFKIYAKKIGLVAECIQETQQGVQ